MSILMGRQFVQKVPKAFYVSSLTGCTPRFSSLRSW